MHCGSHSITGGTKVAASPRHNILLPYCTAVLSCCRRGGCCSEEVCCVTSAYGSRNRNSPPFHTWVSSLLLTTSLVIRRLSESEKSPFPGLRSSSHCSASQSCTQETIYPHSLSYKMPLSYHAQGGYFTAVLQLSASALAVALLYSPLFSHLNLSSTGYWLLVRCPLIYK